jgi:hypothetical protein
MYKSEKNIVAPFQQDQFVDIPGFTQLILHSFGGDIKITLSVMASAKVTLRVAIDNQAFITTLKAEGSGKRLCTAIDLARLIPAGKHMVDVQVRQREAKLQLSDLLLILEEL